MAFDSAFLQAVKASRTNPKLMERETYYDETDGLLHCCRCGYPAVFWAPYPCSDRKILVGVTCPCIEERNRQERETNEKAMRMSKVEANTSRGFESEEMQKWKFSADDGRHSFGMETARKYCIYFDKCRADGFGIVFYGNVGTGKTFAAACIANELLSQGYTVKMTNFTRIVARMQENFKNRSSYFDELAGYDLLIIDDLSTERNTEYMNEQIYELVNARYVAKRPMIFTTNLNDAEMLNPADITKQRIFSRIRERCRFIEFKGKDRRTEDINRFKEYDGIFNF